MEKLYEAILDGLKLSTEFYQKQGSFEDYLVSLQYFVTELRQAYRNSRIKVDYSCQEMQAAYLIAYYPHYVEMTLAILRLLSSDLKFNQTVKACFFGAGPCPEVVGLVQFLAERFLETKQLIANVYDIASNTWTPSRNITRQYVIPQLWQGQVELNSNSLDLCAKQSLQNFGASLKDAHVFVFQNCLNELSDPLVARENFKFLLDTIPQGSTIIIADLQYDQNRNIIQSIKEEINGRNDFEFLNERNLTFRSSLPIPQLISDNLLTGCDWLIPRSRVSFLFLAARKDNQASNYFDDIPF